MLEAPPLPGGVGQREHEEGDIQEKERERRRRGIEYEPAHAERGRAGDERQSDAARGDERAAAGPQSRREGDEGEAERDEEHELGPRRP